MVKFTSVALFLVAAVSDSRVGNLDCNAICKRTTQRDGKIWNFNGKHYVGTPCDANGSYKCATYFEAGSRSPCSGDLSPA
ncbi:hypothetical protein NHQ30_009232 [Ciborinia camelliae]|nr:hypothetical protein NHQ30_009232 [Ciborinia camelliae]